MKTDKWIKIGEFTKGASPFSLGSTNLYAVMERINSKTGMRKYKNVLICSFMDHTGIKCQPEIVNP